MSVVAIKEETDKRIEEVADKVLWVGIGQLGKIISFFKKEGVSKVIMAGQVKHIQIFSGRIARSENAENALEFAEDEIPIH